MSGGNLLDYINQNRNISDERIILFSAQITSGLIFLHSHGIIHT